MCRCDNLSSKSALALVVGFLIPLLPSDFARFIIPGFAGECAFVIIFQFATYIIPPEGGIFLWLKLWKKDII